MMWRFFSRERHRWKLCPNADGYQPKKVFAVKLVGFRSICGWRPNKMKKGLHHKLVELWFHILKWCHPKWPPPVPPSGATDPKVIQASTLQHLIRYCIILWVPVSCLLLLTLNSNCFMKLHKSCVYSIIKLTLLFRSFFIRDVLLWSQAQFNELGLATWVRPWLEKV